MFDFLRNLTKSAEEKRQERLNAYLDGELAPAERSRLEQQVAQDAALRAELEQLRWTKANVRRLPRVRAPRNFTLDPAVYGRTAPGRAWQAYPALRIATALTAFFFAMALILDLLTPAGALQQPVLPLLQGQEAQVAQTESTADQAAAGEESAAEPERAIEAAPLEAPVEEEEVMEAPEAAAGEDEVLTEQVEVTRLVTEEVEAEAFAEEPAEAAAAEAAEDGDSAATKRAAAPAGTGGQITGTEEIAGLAPTPTMTPPVEEIQPEVATDTAPPTLPPSTLPPTVAAGEATAVASAPLEPPQPFPFLLVLEVALGVALVALLGLLLIVRRNL